MVCLLKQVIAPPELLRLRLPLYYGLHPLFVVYLRDLRSNLDTLETTMDR